MKTETKKTESDYDVKQIALAAYLECEPGDLTEERYNFHGLPTFSLGDREYAIGDDDEATDAARAYIADSLWAFNASFIADHAGIRDSRAIKALEEMQGKLCESANELIRAMIGDEEEFADAAISSDGRGHFLSGYDGNENEQEHAGVTYYVYRIN